MALKIVKGSIDRMFDKNLQDLVRGIRNHKDDEVKRPQSKHCHLERFNFRVCDVFGSAHTVVTVIGNLLARKVANAEVN